MDFQEAQARFQWLEGQFRASALSDPQYQSALNELRVTDPWGRLWAPQAHSGVWHVFYCAGPATTLPGISHCSGVA
jgi:hypothetical protein